MGGNKVRRREAKVDKTAFPRFSLLLGAGLLAACFLLVGGALYDFQTGLSTKVHPFFLMGWTPLLAGASLACCWGSSSRVSQLLFLLCSVLAFGLELSPFAVALTLLLASEALKREGLQTASRSVGLFRRTEFLGAPCLALTGVGVLSGLRHSLYWSTALLLGIFTLFYALLGCLVLAFENREALPDGWSYRGHFWRSSRPFYGALFAGFMLVAAFLFPNFVRARARSGSQMGCGSNLKNIGTACEMYFTDHEQYPDSLGALTPDYLRTLPECPAAGRCTYKYQSGHIAYNEPGFKDYYFICCAGENHTSVDIPAGYPQYDSISGLLIR